MPNTIRDGAGKGYLAGVNQDNLLEVKSAMILDGSFQSRKNANAFTWTHDYAYASGDTILWIKNTSSTKKLLIEKVIIAADVNTHWICHFPKATIPAGTEITSTQLNRGSNKISDSISYGEETGNTRGAIFVQGNISPNNTIFMPVEGSIVLGINDEFAIDFEGSGATSGMVSIRAYYEDII